MKYARTAGLFFNTPLALMQAKADEILGFWQRKIDVGSIDFEERQDPFAVRYFACDTLQEVLTVSRRLSDEEVAAIRAEWEAKYAGRPQGGRVARPSRRRLAQHKRPAASSPCPCTA
jgi:hypothetical protein